MKITSLELQNFRGFERLDLRLDPSRTLLVGENGAGKTAILDALSIALSGFAAEVTSSAPLYIHTRDVRTRTFEYEGQLDREPQWPAWVKATAVLKEGVVAWTSSKTSDEAGPDSPRVDLPRMTRALVADVAAGNPRALPVVACYGTPRRSSGKTTAAPKRGIGSRFDGYADALDAGADHRRLADWMFRQTLIELQHRKPVAQLQAVERAVCQCVPEASRFYFDVQTEELTLVRASGDLLPFSALSDGYRNMVALVADIAWRASVLNPHYGSDAAARAEGVVLIDEIELHLHPRWQRRVLGDLRRAFPGIQLVVTTHSPQVISSVHRDELRLLQNNTLLDVHPFVEGRDANGLLEDVLGVPERPEAVRTRIDEMSALFDDERYDDAGKILAGLEAQLGPDDPAVIRGRWILAHEGAGQEHG